LPQKFVTAAIGENEGKYAGACAFEILKRANVDRGQYLKGRNEFATGGEFVNLEPARNGQL
jgi:hypothetical protein